MAGRHSSGSTGAPGFWSGWSVGGWASRFSRPVNRFTSSTVGNSFGRSADVTIGGRRGVVEGANVGEGMVVSMVELAGGALCDAMIAVVIAPPMANATAATVAKTRRRDFRPAGAKFGWPYTGGEATSVGGPPGVWFHHCESGRVPEETPYGSRRSGVRPAMTRPCRAAAAAWASSRAEVNRCAGSLAMAVAITPSIAVDSPGSLSVTFGGRQCKCAAITATAPPPAANGTSPVRSRNSVHPKEYRSARPSKDCPARTSGAA